MAYGLPTRGQADWDDEMNNSVEALRASIQSAEANANVAVSNANHARNKADDLMAIVADGISLPLVEDPDEAGTYLIASHAFISEDPDDAGTYLIGA